MAKKQAVASTKTQNIPPQVVETATPAVRYVTYPEIETLIESINNKFRHVDAKAAETQFRVETLLKTLCQNGDVTYSSFVKGLRQFGVFSKKVDELKAIPKLSDRIKEAIAYNDSLQNTDEFLVLADDIDILKDVVNADSISAENYALCTKLDSTELFRELLHKFKPKS